MSVITKRNDARIAFFIDEQNVTKSTPGKMCRENMMVDYEVLVSEIADGRSVQSAYVFSSTLRGEETAFHDRLRYCGFIVEVREFDDATHSQKEVDMQMGCRLLQQAMLDNFDVAVVVSGDRDFVPAIEMVRNLGKQVEIAGFTGSLSSKLQRSADRVHLLDRLPVVLWRSQPAVAVEEEEDAIIAEEA